MFLRKEERLGILRDKYAKEIDADPNSIKLMFDGDILDLNETPENCDLEGDECIDVVISNNWQVQIRLVAGIATFYYQNYHTSIIQFCFAESVANSVI